MSLLEIAVTESDLASVASIRVRSVYIAARGGAIARNCRHCVDIGLVGGGKLSQVSEDERGTREEQD